MSRCQRDELRRSTVEYHIVKDKERTDSPLHESCKANFKVGLVSDVLNDDLLPKRACSCTHVSHLCLSIRIGRIDKESDDDRRRYQLVQQFQLLWPKLHAQ